MWVESALVVGDQILDAAALDGLTLTVSAIPVDAPRMLLAHVQFEEDAGGTASYVALMCRPLKVT